MVLQPGRWTAERDGDCVVFLIGAAITIWPDPREARQLARRYDAALAREA